MKDYFENDNDNKSSADGVEQHLQTLDNKDAAREQLYYSQEQAFDSAALATIINEARLNKLLVQSDEFVKSLSAEIKDFDDDIENNKNDL